MNQGSMKYWITIVLFVVITFPVISQQYRSELPYRLVGGKMIVEMKLNGTLRSFIFDTGASRTMLTEEVCRELGVIVADSLPVTDANGHKAFYPLVWIDEIQTPDNTFRFKNVAAMKMPEPSPLECFSVDGLIGCDLLKQLILVIDGKKKIVTMTTAEKEAMISFRKMVNFVQSGMPIISILTASGNNLVCLFDTGYSEFLSLRESDFEMLESGSAFEFLSEGCTVGSISVGGVAATRVSRRVNFPLLLIGGTKFRNVISETSTPPYTLLGMKLLDYGKVTLDYSRARFYFEAYKPEYDCTGKTHDLGLQVKDGDLMVAAVWGAMKDVVEMGDKVIKINGKPAGKYDFCESMLNGIPELKAKKKSKLTIQTRQGEKVIVY